VPYEWWARALLAGALLTAVEVGSVIGLHYAPPAASPARAAYFGQAQARDLPAPKPLRSDLGPDELFASLAGDAQDTPPPPAGSPQAIVVQAAQQEGVDPNLLLALSYWESGYRQEAVSSEGAVGLLQVMPQTAEQAGPQLLGRQVDLANPDDNALMGAALLKDLLNKYDRRTALAAYYQGEPALFGGYAAPDTWSYADGVLQIAGAIAAGQDPHSADPR